MAHNKKKIDKKLILFWSVVIYWLISHCLFVWVGGRNAIVDMTVIGPLRAQELKNCQKRWRLEKWSFFSNQGIHWFISHCQLVSGKMLRMLSHKWNPQGHLKGPSRTHKWPIMQKQVTWGHNIVAYGWAGASKPQPHPSPNPKPPSTH